jgi:TPR repeat protein
MRFQSFLALASFTLLVACSHSPQKEAAAEAILPSAPPTVAPAGSPAAVDPNLVEKVEILRAQGLELLYSKDPSIKDPKRAFEKFLAAAKLGDPVSMDHLGGFYSLGEGGVKKDCAQAIAWYEKAASLGYPMALNNLAYTLVSCPDKRLRNPTKAEELMKTLFANTPGLLSALDTYAAVLANDGNFKQAAKTMNVVADLADFTQGNPQQIDSFRAAEAAYTKGKMPTEVEAAPAAKSKKKKKPARRKN